MGICVNICLMKKPTWLYMSKKIMKSQQFLPRGKIHPFRKNITVWQEITTTKQETREPNYCTLCHWSFKKGSILTKFFVATICTDYSQANRLSHALQIIHRNNMHDWWAWLEIVWLTGNNLAIWLHITASAKDCYSTGIETIQMNLYLDIAKYCSLIAQLPIRFKLRT